MRRHLLMLVFCGVALGLTLLACSASGTSSAPSAEQGEVVFQDRCAECHNTTRLRKVGPGLRNLMKREWSMSLPNGMSPSEEGVRSFLLKGGGEHPLFPDMSDRELDNLIEYLKTL